MVPDVSYWHWKLVETESYVMIPESDFKWIILALFFSCLSFYLAGRYSGRKG